MKILKILPIQLDDTVLVLVASPVPVQVWAHASVFALDAADCRYDAKDQDHY